VIEREFRYLVPQLGADQLVGVGVEISQGYLVADPTLAIRVRRTGVAPDQRATLTVKSAMNGSHEESHPWVREGSERHEVEIALTGPQAEELWPLCGDRIITKHRYFVDLPEGGLIAEIDVFSGRWTGLAMVEVEFVDRAQMGSFNPPEWFGRDVTSDSRFANAALALASPQETADLLARIQLQ